MIVPLTNSEVKITPHHSAKIEFGSGAVMVCSYGDQNDVALFRELQLDEVIAIGRYGTKEMLEIFGEQKKVDYQLQIEAAAALSQSEINLIPKSIAKDIAKAARSGKITAKRIKQLEAKSDHDTAALVESLAERCKKESRPWIHYGLTSNLATF